MEFLSFTQYQLLESNDFMILTQENRDFLFKKVEYSKKKKAFETKNELFDLFHRENASFNKEEITKMIKSFEYTFRKNANNALIIKMLEFVPDVITVSYSSIDAKEKRDKKD